MAGLLNEEGEEEEKVSLTPDQKDQFGQLFHTLR